jgi:outer membrane lipoprotein-sorting protein
VILRVLTGSVLHSERMSSPQSPSNDQHQQPNQRTTYRLSRRARWGVPAVAVVAVAAAIGVPLVSADASPSLPAKTAGQLLADVAGSQARPFSGTVVETARLGLPAVPEQASATSPLSLLTGSHTVRVWYGGPQQTRLALVGNLTESDLVRNGTDLWLWSSRDRTAEHVKLPAASASADAAEEAHKRAMAAMTPAQAAAQALAAIDPTTAVSVDGTARVAGRSAYELVLKPKDTRSTVAQVRIAIDAKTRVPLRVQILAKGHSAPAFETGFTTVTFSKPPASVFHFTAPPGTKVSSDLSQALQGSHRGERAVVPDSAGKSLQGKGGANPDGQSAKTSAQPRIIGTGWTSIIEVSGVDLTGRSQNEQAQVLLNSLKPVSGPFGSGRVLKTSLLNVLLLDNGKAYIGAVPLSMLEDAATVAVHPKPAGAK